MTLFLALVAIFSRRKTVEVCEFDGVLADIKEGNWKHTRLCYSAFDAVNPPVYLVVEAWSGLYIEEA